MVVEDGGNGGVGGCTWWWWRWRRKKNDVGCDKAKYLKEAARSTRERRWGGVGKP